MQRSRHSVDWWGSPCVTNVFAKYQSDRSKGLTVTQTDLTKWVQRATGCTKARSTVAMKYAQYNKEQKNKSGDELLIELMDRTPKVQNLISAYINNKYKRNQMDLVNEISKYLGKTIPSGVLSKYLITKCNIKLKSPTVIGQRNVKNFVVSIPRSAEKQPAPGNVTLEKNKVNETERGLYVIPPSSAKGSTLLPTPSTPKTTRNPRQTKKQKPNPPANA